MSSRRGITEFYGLLRNLLASVLIFTFVASAFAKEEYATSWKSLSGYSKLVWDIKYSPKGNYFALTIGDNTTELYDKSWKKLWSFQENLAYPGALVFMPDEKSLVIARNHKADSEICILAIPDRRELQTIKNKGSHVNELNISPDGKFIASADSDEKISIYRILDNKLHKIQALDGHTSDVNGISFSKDGEYLASASSDKTVKIWKNSGGRFYINQTIKNEDNIHDVAFNRNNTYLAIGGADKTIKLFRLKDGRFFRNQTLKDNEDTVYNLSFSPDGNYLAAASGDKTVRIWKLYDKKFGQIQTLISHTDTVYRVLFSPDGQYLASAGGDKNVKIWKIN